MAKTKKVADVQEPQQQPAKVSTQTEAPHEVNSALSSDRMQALLKDHQEMGARPK